MSNYIHELYVKLQCTLLYLYWLILCTAILILTYIIQCTYIGSKDHEVNQVIKKVNNLLKTLCLEHGFTFNFNSAIARAMLWCDDLPLTNEGTNMLSNNFLQYLKNVPLVNDNRIFTDWQANQGRAKGSYKGIKWFSPKDPEVPKLSNITNSKLELSCITNIKKFEVKILTIWS